MLNIIVAMAPNYVIGKWDKLPWGKPIPAIDEWVKEKTAGAVVVMGRHNWELLGRKPLPGCKNIVFTRESTVYERECTVMTDHKEVVELAQTQEVFVIGGAKTYERFFPFARRLYVAYVHKECTGNAEFPTIFEHEWRRPREHRARPGDNTPFHLTFLEYERW